MESVTYGVDVKGEPSLAQDVGVIAQISIAAKQAWFVPVGGWVE